MAISLRIGDWLVEPDQNRLVRGEHDEVRPLEVQPGVTKSRLWVFI
jgi:hypothetical protein